MAEKMVNYTAEQTAELRGAYVAAPTAETVKTFAEKFGKSTKSIIAKLVREGVYQKAEYVTKTGEKPVKKDEQADAIAAILGLSEGEADSLAKANKTALAKIFRALANSVPVEPETPEETRRKAEILPGLAQAAELDASEAKSLSRASVGVVAKLANALGIP